MVGRLSRDAEVPNPFYMELIPSVSEPNPEDPKFHHVSLEVDNKFEHSEVHPHGISKKRIIGLLEDIQHTLFQGPNDCLLVLRDVL